MAFISSGKATNEDLSRASSRKAISDILLAQTGSLVAITKVGAKSDCARKERRTVPRNVVSY